MWDQGVFTPIFPKVLHGYGKWEARKWAPKLTGVSQVLKHDIPELEFASNY